MLYMMAHSLSKFAQGRWPVAISKITQPRDQTSTAPVRPGFSPLITSGDMYMGVPVMDLLALVPAILAISVLPCRAITLAAPKSTYLITPLWSRRMSGTERLASVPTADLCKLVRLGRHRLTLRLDIPVRDVAGVEVRQPFQKLKCVDLNDRLILNPPVFK